MAWAVVFLFALAYGQDTYVTVEPEALMFNGWSKLNKPSPDEILEVRFNLQQRNLALLEETLYSVSDPMSPNYRNFLSHETLREMIAPREADVESLKSWIRRTALSHYFQRGLSTHQLFSMTSNKLGDYLFCKMTVDLADFMFKTDIHAFTRKVNQKSKRSKVFSTKIYRSRIAYSIPMSLTKIVRSISGLTDFPPLRASKYLPSAEPGQTVTPSVLRTTYHININGTSDPSNGQALAEFEEEYFYPADLNIFQAKYGLPVQNVSNIVGTNDPDEGDLGEASLDVQYIMAAGVNTVTWVWSLYSFDLVNWAINITETPHAPPVHSISYGSPETAFPNSSLTQANIEFQKLGTLGFTVLVASGDDGTGHTGFLRCTKFNGNFPATSPYVTSVGGTYLNIQDNSEIGVGFSGGGFSNVFSQPPYQAAAVAQYLKSSGLPSQKLYNPTGRGFPDVSALSTNYLVTIQGFEGPISGTSASCPVFAGLIGLLNGKLIESKKPPLGFLNPLLYQLNTAGIDVVQGNNKVVSCPAGFPAVAGWDAVTGLGSPNFAFLAQKILGNN